MCSSILRSCDGLRTAASFEQNPRSILSGRIRPLTPTFLSPRLELASDCYPPVLQCPSEIVSVKPAGLRDRPFVTPRIPDGAPRTADPAARITPAFII